jgi:hypothetical protein
VIWPSCLSAHDRRPAGRSRRRPFRGRGISGRQAATADPQPFSETVTPSSRLRSHHRGLLCAPHPPCVWLICLRCPQPYSCNQRIEDRREFRATIAQTGCRRAALLVEIQAQSGADCHGRIVGVSPARFHRASSPASSFPFATFASCQLRRARRFVYVQVVFTRSVRVTGDSSAARGRHRYHLPEPYMWLRRRAGRPRMCGFNVVQCVRFGAGGGAPWCSFESDLKCEKPYTQLSSSTKFFRTCCIPSLRPALWAETILSPAAIT